MKKSCLIICLFITFFLSYSYTYAINSNENNNYPYCQNGSDLQLKASSELKELAKADQKDRDNWQQMAEKQIIEVAHRDRIRRERVGEIFGAGCFHDSSDYMAAALIYQHGDTPDHYFQAFIWAKRASELGDTSGKGFSALAIDRYLISIGKKQLFGSQYQKIPPSQCFCMQPVEKSFPDDYRKEYSGRSLSDNYKMMDSINETACPSIECQTYLQPTPKGSIVGLW